MISASIVLFNQDVKVLKKTIDSFLKVKLEKKLFLIDNSTSKSLKNITNSTEVDYVFVGKNIGFGKAHNLVLNQLNSDYHLILNPDIEFTSLVLPNLIRVLKQYNNISFITPKVVYPNNDNQFICRKHPTLLSLIKRKVIKSFNQYSQQELEKPFYPEFIHGCFMLFKTDDFKKLKGFDERYFLYMEDADICRKIEESGKNILYYPKEKIIHHHQKGSSKSIKLFFIHLNSAFKYFLKWGF